MNDPADICDPILSRCVTGERRVPGVVACGTDRHGDVHRRAAGERRLGGEAMREDSVFATVSTTKAITGTTALPCVEEGLLDLDAPAAMLAPAIPSSSPPPADDGVRPPPVGGHNMRQVPFLRLYARRPAPAAWAAAIPTRKSAIWRSAVAQPGRGTAAASMTSVMAPTKPPTLNRIKCNYINELMLWHAS